MKEYPEPDESLVGYARVSTEDQDCSLQIEALRRAGVHPELICVDQKSGRTFKRDGLRLALKFCQRGCTLVFWKLDRLGRDLVEVVLTINRLKERGVKFRSITEPFVNTEAVDTAMGRMFFYQTAMWGEMESLLISERTKAGMREGKRQGAVYGRQGFEKQYVESGILAKYREYRERGLNIEQARKAVKADFPGVFKPLKDGIPRSTITKWKEAFEPPDDIGEADEE